MQATLYHTKDSCNTREDSCGKSLHVQFELRSYCARGDALATLLAKAGGEP